MLGLNKGLSIFFLSTAIFFVFGYGIEKHHPSNLSQRQLTAIQRAIDNDGDLRELTELAPDLVNYEYIFANENSTESINIESRVGYSTTPTPLVPENTSPIRNTPIESPAVVSNIILIIADDQRYDAVEKMPFLRSQTEDWHTFTRAYANVALCCPSRAAIMSGLLSHHSGAEDNDGKPFFNENDNLVTRLKYAGYQTAIIGKYLNKWAGASGTPLNPYTPSGWDNFTVFLDPIDYYDYSIYENGSITAYGADPQDYSTDVLGQKALDFINNAQQPFFLMYTPFAPHQPYLPAPKYETADVGTVTLPQAFFESDFSDKPNWVRELPERDFYEMRRHLTQQYRMALSVDEWIGNIFDALKERGIEEDTYIIYVSDNSFSHGEHKIIGKICGYEYCNHIALRIRYPGVSSTTVNDVVSNVDLAPTIADIAGIPYPDADGFSLVPYIKGATDYNPREGVLIHWGGQRGYDIPHFWGIVEGDYKYIELETGEIELYNLTTDPDELHNLAYKPGYTQLIAKLHQDLIELID